MLAGESDCAQAEATRGKAEVVTGRVSAALCGYDWERFERDRVAELLELDHEATRSSFGILTVGEVVVAEILEHLAGAEQVPGEFDQRMRDGDGGLVRAATAGDLTILGAEVAALRSDGGASRFNQRAAEPLVAGRGADPAAFAGGFVATWADTIQDARTD